MAKPTVLAITVQGVAGQEPVTGGVDPETLITISGQGFDPDAVVRANVAMFPDLRVQSRRSGATDEIQCYIPSMHALETSPHYARDTIQMNLEVTVINAGGEGEASAANRFPVRLGPPQLGPPRRSGFTLTFGAAAGEGESEDPTDHLGGSAGAGNADDGGQVRWYARESAPNLPSIDFAAVVLTTPPTDVESGRVVLPHALAGQLAAARDAGRRLAADPGDWHDDGLVTTVPDENGFIVVWRDDIPSAAVEVTSLLPPGTCPSVPRLLAQAYKLEAPSGTVLAPGQPFAFTAVRDTSVTNVLTPLIDNNLIWVEFAFKVSGIPDQDLQASPNLGNNPTPSMSTQATALVRPFLFPGEWDRNRGTDFTVELELSTTILECGPDPIVAAGASLSCTQLALPVSTIAVFFENSNFSDWPMVMLPATTAIPGLAGQKFDHNSGGVLTARNAVADELGNLSTVLSLLSVFAGIGGIPGAAELDFISHVVDQIHNQSQGVIDTRGENSNLETAVVDTFWWRPDEDCDSELSALILIAVPGFGTLDGFRDSSFTNEEQTWGMPDDHIVAAIPDFENMRAPFTFEGVEMVLPYTDPDQDERSSGHDFDAAMSSIRYDLAPEPPPNL